MPLPAADALVLDVDDDDEELLGWDDVELLGCDDAELLGLEAVEALDFIAFVRMNPALALALPVVPVAPGVDVDADACGPRCRQPVIMTVSAFELSDL